MSKRKTVFAKMKQLRKQNDKYDIIVLDAEKAIENFIAKNSAKKLYRQKTLKVFCLGIPFTDEEKSLLEEYLTKKYIHRLFGDYISIKKFIFSDVYKITSKCR